MHTWTTRFQALINNFNTLIQQEETRAMVKSNEYLMPMVQGERWASEELERFDVLVDRTFDQLLSSKAAMLIGSSKSKSLKLERIAESTGDAVLISALKIGLMQQELCELSDFTYYHCRLAAFQNIEKVFDFGVEAYKGWLTQKTTESIKKKRDPSLRQRFSIPMNFTAPGSTQNEKHKPRKRLAALAAAKELTRNCGMLVRDFQAINKAIPDEDNKPPKLPEKFFYGREPVTAEFPIALRQPLYDLFFLRELLLEAKNKLQAQRTLVRTLLLVWASSGISLANESWEWARDHVHNMPAFQKYEYLRVEMFAVFEIAYREEEKIHDYFDTNGSSPLTAGVEKLMKVGALTKAERLETYKKHCDSFFEHTASVDLMLQQLDEAKPPTAAELNDIPDEWLKEFVASGLGFPK
ncbi:MAG: hypothetical protein Q9195_008352 [Heterodermia aff. obscurata]